MTQLPMIHVEELDTTTLDALTHENGTPIHLDDGWTDEDEAHNNHLINLIMIEQYPWNF